MELRRNSLSSRHLGVKFDEYFDEFKGGFDAEQVGAAASHG